MKISLLRATLAAGLSLFAGSAMADAIKDVLLAWGQEMREAEAAAPTDHPATYNSQTGRFYLGVFEAVNARTGAQWNAFRAAVLPGNVRADLAASYAAQRRALHA